MIKRRELPAGRDSLSDIRMRRRSLGGATTRCARLWRSHPKTTLEHCTGQAARSVTVERNPGPSLRGPDPFRSGPKQSRRLGRGGPRGRALMWARSAGTASCVATLNTGTSESCGSLLGLVGRKSSRRSVATRARNPDASDPHQRPAPLHRWCPSTASRNRLRRPGSHGFSPPSPRARSLASGHESRGPGAVKSA